MAFDDPKNFVEDQAIHDQELLELQKRKSVPAFVISEFVAADSDEDSGQEDNKKDESPEEQFEKQVAAQKKNQIKRKMSRLGGKHEELIHVECKNVSSILLCNNFVKLLAFL